MLFTWDCWTVYANFLLLLGTVYFLFISCLFPVYFLLYIHYSCCIWWNVFLQSRRPPGRLKGGLGRRPIWVHMGPIWARMGLIWTDMDPYGPPHIVPILWFIILICWCWGPGMPPLLSATDKDFLWYRPLCGWSGVYILYIYIYLVVSDGMYSFNLGGLQADLKGGSGEAAAPSQQQQQRQRQYILLDTTFIKTI